MFVDFQAVCGQFEPLLKGQSKKKDQPSLGVDDDEEADEWDDDEEDDELDEPEAETLEAAQLILEKSNEELELIWANSA